MRAVAVSGAGVVCAVARNRREFSAALQRAQSGITQVERLETRWIGDAVAGEVKGWDPLGHVGDTPSPLTRADAFAVLAAREAVAEAGIDLSCLAPERIGVAIGTCQGNIEELVQFLEAADEPSAPAFRSSADAVAHALGARGERLVLSNACTAGATAIAALVEKLLGKEIDVAVVGGTDELIYFSLAAFTVLQSLDARPCAPYSRSTGLTVGEGAGILVLERAEQALERGHRPPAYLLGFGMSADGYHATAPDPTGRGGVLAVRRALAAAGVDVSDVDYVNGHGTGTLANDQMERKVLRAVFGSRPALPPMSSTKSIIGHLLGAAGAVEAVSCLTAIGDNILPPTLNVDDEAAVDFDCVPNVARDSSVNVATSTNYAFGGANSALVFGRSIPTTRAEPEAGTPSPRVFVSSMSAVGAPGVGLDAWRDFLAQGVSCFNQTPPSPQRIGGPPPVSPRGVTSPDVWRRMDSLARLAVVSARLAWNALGTLSPEECDETAVVLGTMFGSLELYLRFESSARRGEYQASARDVPHTSQNSAAGHICTVLGLHGPLVSFSNGALAGFSAFNLGCELIRSGRTGRVLVTSVDELSDPLLRLMPGFGYTLSSGIPRPFDEANAGTRIGSAAVTLVLESEKVLNTNSRPYAEVLGAAAIGTPADDKTDRAMWKYVMSLASDRSAIAPSQVGYIAAAATGMGVDEEEAAAISEVFGRHVSVGAPKSIVGECLSSGAPVGILAGSLALREGLLTPALGAPDPRDSPLRLLAQPLTSSSLEYVMVNAAAPSGGVGSIVLRRA